MTRFVARANIIFLLSIVGLGCGTNGEALALAGSGNLTITTSTTVSAAAINNGGSGLEATVRNNGSQTVYTKAGDTFNSAEEQDPFHTSNDSDAEVEGKNSNGAWTQLDTGIMIEGTKYIALKPGKTYRLISVINAPTFRGQARIRLAYSTVPDASGTVAVDYSNVFEIR